MLKLDLKDKKLLYYLSENARTSQTQLSRKIKLSKNAVKYRIERLQKESVIKHFAAVVNIGAIKYTTITLLLRFNEDIYEKSEIIAYFQEHLWTDWVITLSGQWDLFVELVCKDFKQLEEFLSELRGHFGSSLNTYQTFFSHDTLRVEHLVADFYQDIKVEPLPMKKRTKEKYELDQTDAKILHLLNQDSSLPYLTMAEKLNLTLDIVRYRIKNLLEKQIIIKFFPEISLPKLGYTEYLYTLKLKNNSSEKIEALKKKIQLNNNVTYAFFDQHSSHLIFVCAFKTPEDIDHLSRGIRKEFVEIIDEQNYLIIKEQVLFNLFPKGLVES